MQNNDLKTPTDLTGNNKLSTNKINIKIQTYEDESIDCAWDGGFTAHWNNKDVQKDMGVN